MATHELKTLGEYFYAVLEGRKKFEVRRNDRGFEVGDTLILKLDPPHRQFDFVPIKKRVTYILPGGQYGIDPNYCVLGLGEPHE